MIKTDFYLTDRDLYLIQVKRQALAEMIEENRLSLVQRVVLWFKRRFGG